MKAHIQQMCSLVSAGRLVEARNIAVGLAQASPGNATLWRMRGDLHLRLHEYESAIECIHHVISLSSPLDRNAFIELHHVLGTTYFKTAQIPDAIAALDKIIAMEPEHEGVRTLRAVCYSLLGDFERGWPDYEYRRRLKMFSTQHRSVPVWDGGDIKGKTILVYAEQGLGDTIQFCRYLPQVKALGATVYFSTQPLLTKLLSSNDCSDLVLSDGDPFPPYDVEIPLMSLMYIFHTTLDNIPGHTPYLKAPADAGKPAKKIISECNNKLRVGFVWKGNTQRELTLNKLADWFYITGIQFFSLQKGEPTKELVPPLSDLIVDLGSTFDNFVDTTAAIQDLDLIISVDTSMAHLAGALGKPVWTMLPFAPDWRWMLNREDSPWYPTMRLFRQPKPGDWASVIQRVTEELKTLVDTKK